MSHLYPLLLDVKDRLIVIIGGGPVAVRKASGLIDAGANQIRVVAPEIAITMPAVVQRMTDMYRREHLNGASLVFAATDDAAVNAQVVADAHSMNLLVCRVDDNDDEVAADFVNPAAWRRGPVMLTVSTGGSPALAVKIRDTIAAGLDSRLIELADIARRVRSVIRNHPRIDPFRRREIFRWLASDEAIAAIKGGVNELGRAALARFPELKDLASEFHRA
jgi:siroheme synthase-like protein